jgi:membrane-bound lytic murein transglycosylase B
MRRIILTIFISMSASLYTLPSAAIDLGVNPEVRNYINTIAQKYNYDERDLYRWFNIINFNQSIIDSMNKPGEAKPWENYRDIFIQPERIQMGKDYMSTHMKALKAAERQYGVPADIILGIIGVETYYGKVTGKSYVLEALATIAFKYPPRSKYFTNELTEFLLLCREQGWNPLEIRGSYAGAMGLPQFMPSSYRTYAIDGSKNGYINLFDDHQDVIASVANYLDKKGWHRGEPVAVPVNVRPNHKEFTEAEANGKLNYTVQQLADLGFVPIMPVPKHLKVGLLGFETEYGMQYWMTFHNFQVIKRYNNSGKYALVVALLGDFVSGAVVLGKPAMKAMSASH